MNTWRQNFILMVGLILSLLACSPGQLSGSTFTPSSTIALPPTTTSTLTATSPLPPTSTSTLSALPTLTASPTLISTPFGGSSGILIFDERKERFKSIFPDLQGEWHVFRINIDGTELHPITVGFKGYNLIADVSPDGHRILIESVPNFYGPYTYGDLYVMNSDGTNPIKLSDQHLTHLAIGSKTAYWMDDQSIAFIAKNGKGTAIWTIKLDGSGPQLVTNPDQIPSRLIPSRDLNEIFWHESADQADLTHISGYRVTQLSSMETITIDDYSPLFIFDRSMIVEEKYKLYLLSDDVSSKIYIGETLCSPCIFPSPDGLKQILKH